MGVYGGITTSFIDNFPAKWYGSTSISGGVVIDGLVLALDAGVSRSYPGSGTTWTDLSGNGNTGTLVNGVGYNSANLGSLSFDGSNDYVDCGKTATQLGIYNSSYTMSAFFRVPNLSGDKMVFGTPTTAGNQGMHHGVRNNTFYFGHYGSDIGGGTVVANTWYFGTWVWSSGGSTSIYINGSSVASGTTNGFVGTANIRVGSSWVVFNGNIAQVSIYNRALTAQEIQQNFNALRSRFSI